MTLVLRGIALAFLVGWVSGLEILPSHGQPASGLPPECAAANSALVAPMGMASTSDGELVIADRGLQAVLIVDPTTGACRLISSDRRGSGNSFNAPVGVVADAQTY
jgi:hypothetical protein